MFDRQKFHDAIRKHTSARLACGHVHYSDEGWVPNLHLDPLAINLAGCSTEKQIETRVQEHASRNWQALFLRKLTDWSHEREYRWILFDDTDDPRDIPFADALKAIVIGHGVPKELERQFYKHCIRHESACAYLHWRNGQPSIQHYAEPYVTHKLLPGYADEDHHS